MKSLLLFGFLVLSASSLAQFMIPQTTTIRTPYGNVNHTTYTRMPMYNYGTNGPISNKYEFYIVFKDSSEQVTRARILMDSINTITIKEQKNEQVVKPAETNELYRILPNGMRFSGQPADSCWLFLCYKGKINAYSNLAEEDLTYAIAIQKGEGPIVALTATELEKMIDSDDPKMAKLLKRRKFVQVIKAYNAQ
jgi:hypothetical protein